MKQILNLFIKGEHNHAPDAEKLKATKIAAEVKQTALADVFKLASAIVDEVHQEQLDVAASCPALLSIWPEMLTAPTSSSIPKIRST